ncbi:MAG: glycosyltransferase family 39 protein, partial [Acidobacteriota bacterium]
MTDATQAHPVRSAVAAGLACLAVQGWAAWTTPSIGFAKYTLAVRQWAEGTLAPERLVDFSPAYFRLVELVASLTEQPERWLVGLQIVLVAVTVGGVHGLIARRLSPRLAWLGSGLLILDRHLLIYARVLEPEILLLASLMAVAVLLEPSPAGDSPRWRDVTAGLVAGLAIATRPTFLPVFALIPAFHALRGVPAGRLVRRSAPFLLAMLPGLILMFATTHEATGELGTPVMNPGTVFFEGHHPLSHGTSAIYPPAVAARLGEIRGVPDPAHVLYRQIARAEVDCTGVTAASIGEVNARWSDLARHHLLADPAVSLRRIAIKARYAFHSFRWHDLPAAWVLDGRLRLPAVPFAVVSALALLGLIAESRRWRDALIFYTLLAIPLAVMLAFYVSARQRLVAIPALVYFALIGIEALRGRRSEAIRPWIGGLLAVVLVPLFV